MPDLAKRFRNHASSTPPIREESRFEDHDSSPFCVVNANRRRETFQLRRALRKKRGQQYYSRDARVRLRVLRYYNLVNVEVALYKQSRLIDGPSVLPDRNSLVARINLDNDNLLVRSLSHPDLLQPRWSQTISDQSLRSFSVLDDFYLTARHTPQHVDVLPTLTDRQAHIARLGHENDPLQLLVNNTILGRRPGNTIEQGHVLHLLARQFNLGLEHHFFSATSFKTSESPCSRTTIAETGKGFSQTAPRSRLDPGKT